MYYYVVVSDIHVHVHTYAPKIFPSNLVKTDCSIDCFSIIVFTYSMYIDTDTNMHKLVHNSEAAGCGM